MKDAAKAVRRLAAAAAADAAEVDAADADPPLVDPDNVARDDAPPPCLLRLEEGVDDVAGESRSSTRFLERSPPPPWPPTAASFPRRDPPPPPPFAPPLFASETDASQHGDGDDAPTAREEGEPRDDAGEDEDDISSDGDAGSRVSSLSSSAPRCDLMRSTSDEGPHV